MKSRTVMMVVGIGLGALMGCGASGGDDAANGNAALSGDEANAPMSDEQACAGVGDAMSICGEDIGKERGALYTCMTDDSDRRVLFRQCTCKGGCERGAHQAGCECEEPASTACGAVDDEIGLCGQLIGRDPGSLFMCKTDDAGKRILALSCKCDGECSVGAHQGGCTCAR